MGRGRERSYRQHALALSRHRPATEGRRHPRRKTIAGAIALTLPARIHSRLFVSNGVTGFSSNIPELSLALRANRATLSGLPRLDVQPTATTTEAPSAHSGNTSRRSSASASSETGCSSGQAASGCSKTRCAAGSTGCRITPGTSATCRSSPGNHVLRQRRRIRHHLDSCGRNRRRRLVFPSGS